MGYRTALGVIFVFQAQRRGGFFLRFKVGCPLKLAPYLKP